MSTLPTTALSFPSWRCVVLVFLSAGLASACSKGASKPGPVQERWPGPCSASWVVHEVVDIAGMEITTPFAQGAMRVMRFHYSPQGLLLGIDDDDDNDGTPDSTVRFTYDKQGRVTREVFDRDANGEPEQERVYYYQAGEGGLVGYILRHQADGSIQEDSYPDLEPLGRTWDRCHGECRYDAQGNLLEDRATDGQDVLRYDYRCWPGG